MKLPKVFWPFMRCTNCGHGQTFAHHLTRRGRAVGNCDKCGPNRQWIDYMKTKLIGLFVVALLFGGCASLTPERIAVLAAIAGSAAEIGASEWLEKHPTHRDAFRLAIDAFISTLAESDSPRSEQKAVEMLNSLPTSTLAGPAGELYISDTNLVVWDASRRKATAAKGPIAKPVLEATKRGLTKAIEKKAMPPRVEARQRSMTNSLSTSNTVSANP